jgi:hypothetical protein
MKAAGSVAYSPTSPNENATEHDQSVQLKLPVARSELRTLIHTRQDRCRDLDQSAQRNLLGQS